MMCFFFFQAEDGIRDYKVTGVQTCALPIFNSLQLTAYLPLLAALAGLFALWQIRGKWSRPVLFAAAYFVVSLFPVLGFFTVYFFRYSFVSDHFQYLASMGPFALAGAGITAVADSLKWKPFLRGALCGILLLLLGFSTCRQSA